LLVQELGLAEAIDQRLDLLKIHLPYHESDHVLNLAYNALCDGDCLEDLELRRNDEVYLNALGARRIPDPTTAGDFCRRFQPRMSAPCSTFITQRGGRSGPGSQSSSSRRPASTWTACWSTPTASARRAWISRTKAKARGVIIRWSCLWPSTGEVLSIVNRSATGPATKGRPTRWIALLEVCFAGGFHQVLLRGDTDFTQTRHVDRWSNDARVRFIFAWTARRSYTF